MAETDLWFGTLSATVRVEDLPASRRVVAIELPANGEWRVCGSGASNADGIAVLPISGLPTSRIYAVAIDDWGRPFVPNMTVSYGDVIRPTQFVGWMYQVTQPGVLPVTEPDWWNSMAGIPQPVGTAMMQAIRHYQPIAHGPVSDIEWVEMEFDPYWDNVVALLHFDGDNGGTIFADETGKLVTRNGASITTRTDVFRFGGASARFVGDASYLEYPYSSDFDLSEEDFTIEFWLNLQAWAGNSAYGTILSKRTGGADHDWTIFNNSRDIVMQYYNGSIGNAAIVLGTHTDIQGQFGHFAVCREGSQLRTYKNGVPQEARTLTANLRNRTSAIRMGRSMNYTDSYLNAYLDELRITKGIARYTENFTPPTAPFPNIGPPL